LGVSGATTVSSLAVSGNLIATGTNIKIDSTGNTSIGGKLTSAGYNITPVKFRLKSRGNNGYMRADSSTSVTHTMTDRNDDDYYWYWNGPILYSFKHGTALQLNTTTGGGGYGTVILAPFNGDGRFFWNYGRLNDYWGPKIYNFQYDRCLRGQTGTIDLWIGNAGEDCGWHYVG